MTNQDAETYIRLRWQTMFAETRDVATVAKRIATTKLRPHWALSAVCNDLDRRRDWKGYAALIRSQPKGRP